MTKEELEKEAKKECFILTVNTICIDQKDVELAYVMGAEPREKRIAELEAQIEKMKCCENCKYNSYWGNELHCNYGLKEALQEDKLVECKDMDKWEVKGNG